MLPLARVFANALTAPFRWWSSDDDTLVAGPWSLPTRQPAAAGTPVELPRSAALCPESWAPGLLADHQIRVLAREYDMITPFVDHSVSVDPDTGIKLGGSYGLSSYGYDARLAPDYRVFTNVNQAVIDAENFEETVFVSKTGPEVIAPPNSFILGATMERFLIPRDVLVIALGKSTLARMGVVPNVTPLEPAWHGQVTLEFSNTAPLPVRMRAGRGVVQLLFFKASAPCDVTYADRGGKYQGQVGVVPPRA